jgi:glutaconate CoA-transferase subunit B
MTDFTLAELMIVAAADAFRGNGEILASGIGTLPRLGAGLARLTHTPELMMTDGEAYLVEEPVPLGGASPARGGFTGCMSYARVFDMVWSGRRHVMIGPIQIDRWGQANLSAIGDYARPKLAMLGMRGLPGNSISHANSMLVTAHSKRIFVANEVDVVGGAGYNPTRWRDSKRRDSIDLRRIITNLCVMDFEGPDHAIRVRSLHPGVSYDEVQDQTGFPLIHPEGLGETAAPTQAELTIITRLDPTVQRARVLDGNPPGDRRATKGEAHG